MLSSSSQRPLVHRAHANQTDTTWQTGQNPFHGIGMQQRSAAATPVRKKHAAGWPQPTSKLEQQPHTTKSATDTSQGNIGRSRRAKLYLAINRVCI